MSGILPEERALKFIRSRKTLFLATANASGALWASYSPFVFHNNVFYASANYIGRRTRDLLATGKACIILRADEHDAPNLFGMERYTVNCNSTVISRDSAEWNEVIPLFWKKFGKDFNFSFGLPDFYLFRLDPAQPSPDEAELTEKARYVLGFAKAYDIASDQKSSEHVQGGHNEREGVPTVVKTEVVKKPRKKKVVKRVPIKGIK